MKKNSTPYKLIYNPLAGRKRRLLTGEPTRLVDIVKVFTQYQMPVDPVPLRAFGKVDELVTGIIRDGFSTILVAGGDGTVGTVANAMVGKKATLGILPLGSFMNIARMLAIPNDLEQAVMTIKIGRTRKIDVGKLSRLSGEKPVSETYFLESAGIGIEAEMHKQVLSVEKGNYDSLVTIVKRLIDFSLQPLTIVLDRKKTISTTSGHVTVSNGPLTGASLLIAPEAKLNDHRLTVSIHTMDKNELLGYYMNLLKRENKKISSKKIKTYDAEHVRLSSTKEIQVHADGRIFGQTPATFEIVPNALTVICGFPKDDDNHGLAPRTYLDLY